MSDLNRKCENCRFWQHTHTPHTGECRRQAPTTDNTNTEQAVWPITASIDWCGEFEARWGTAQT